MMIGKAKSHIKRMDPLKNNPLFDRRSFIRICGLMGLSLASEVFTPRNTGALEFNRKLFRVTGTFLAMGTTVSMALVSSSRDKAEAAMKAGCEEMSRLSGLMNGFDDGSPVAILNKEGVLKQADPEIIEVITSALKYYRLTGGVFDITIKPVIDLFGQKFSRGENIYPTEEEIEKVLELVGSDMIQIQGRDITLEKPGMGITLDGIAKGYIVDCVSKIFLEREIENHLINAGGDIKARGIRDDGKPWVIAIQDPVKKDRHLDVIHLCDAAVGTSGNYENYFDREKMFHHIANPKTGISPVLTASASVIAPTGMEADALATSLLVMNPIEGIRFIDSLPEREALVISRTNRMQRSAGWKNVSL
jgi:thiamine biosynthesis lipoprotein